MDTRKRILIVCGSGVATSTVVAQRVRAILDQSGLEADLRQCAVMDAAHEAKGADLIIATTQVSADLGVPVINGIPFLIGVGAERLAAQIVAQLKQ